MTPISAETRQPIQVERKAPARKAKAKEIAKKAIPKETREWLIKAGKKLQHKDGRKSLEVLATPPPNNFRRW